MTLRKRIYLTMCSLAALSVAGMAVTLWVDHRVSGQRDRIAERDRQLTELTASIRFDMLQMSDAMRGMLLDPGSASEKKRKLDADDNLVRDVNRVKVVLAGEPKLITTIDAVGEFDEKTLNALENKVIQLIGTDVTTAAKFYHESYLPARVEQLKMLEAFEAAVKTLTSQDRARSNAGRIVGVGAVVVLLLVSLVLAQMQVRSIQHVLCGNIDALTAASHQVSSAATQMSSASHSLAQGASEQASSLQATSSALEEMSGMTQRNAENAHEAKELANQTRSAADLGAADMQRMASAMSDIKAGSDNIAKVIKTIDEIAFQTNILALNAAVEAARAGEAGLGFAVVAGEVRNLAQRSAEAAKETASRIEDAIHKSDRGVEITSRVSASLLEIVTKARQMDQLVASIATACTDQNQGIGQINRALSQMDHVTQANASGAEEGASAAEELQAQAKALHYAVEDLQKLATGRVVGEHAREHQSARTKGQASPAALFLESRFHNGAMTLRGD